MVQESLEEGVPLIDSLINEAKPFSSITIAVLFSTFVAVCGSFGFGCAIGYSSAGMFGIMEDLGLSVADYSMFGSLLTFGGMIGAIFSGKITALVGPKHSMACSQIFCTMGWLAIALAKSVWWLYIGRLSLGVGVGFVSYAVPIYIAEITPKNIRGRFIFSNQLLQNCGGAVLYIIGNFVDWRTLAITSLVPCMLQLIGLFFIPESPRWLVKHNREKEFEAALQCLRGKNADISEEAADIRDTTEMLEQDSKVGILSLFQRRYAHAVTVGIGLMLLQQLSGVSGVTYYLSNIFEAANFPIAVGTTIVALVTIPKAIFGLFLVDKWGRRPLLMVSASGMCLSCALLGLSFSFKDFEQFKDITPVATFIGTMGNIMFFAVGLGGLPWIIMSEIFPPNVKVVAGSLVNLTNWTTSWVITYTFNFMLQWSPSGTFFIFTSVLAGTVIFVWTLVPETKGRTLEDIQTSLTRLH